jgi:hypothetical protein
LIIRFKQDFFFESNFDIEIVRLLIAAGADVNAVAEWSGTYVLECVLPRATFVQKMNISRLVW